MTEDIKYEGLTNLNNRMSGAIAEFVDEKLGWKELVHVIDGQEFVITIQRKAR